MDTTSKSQLIVCPACGVTNRVAAESRKQGRAPVCGRCKTPLTLTTKPVVVTDASFANLVERAPLPVLVDFWAAWCGPCRAIAPVIEELAKELSGRVRVAKLDVDANPQSAARFQVRSIPTLLIFQSGREVDRLVGVVPKADILRRLAPLR